MDSSSDVEREDGPSLLVVDDNPSISKLLATSLRSEGFAHIATAGSAAAARAQLLDRAFDVVITDISMPDGDGIELMQWAGEHCPGASWMVLTGHATVDAAVRALQLGAFDFITKPLLGLASLRNAVHNALAHRRLVSERDELLTALKERNAQLAEHVEQLEAACALLDDQGEILRADLRRAAFIQQALLPQSAPPLADHQIHAVYRPCENVAGDLYDVVRLSDHHLAVVVADAAGHGLSAAMLAVLFRNQLPLEHPESGEPLQPREALHLVNRSLAAGLSAPGLFITAAYCLLDTRTGRLQMASAGHPAILLRRRAGGVERFLHSGPALALYADAAFTQYETALEPGDRLLLHTDGVYAHLEGGAADDEERLAALLERESSSAGTLLEEILHKAGGVPNEDDVTIVVLDVTPGASSLDNGAPLTAPAPPAPALPSRNDVLIGVADGRTAVCIRGRGDWTQSAAFYRECSTALDADRQVVLDLTLCQHLDSTFLGTIHELAERAEREYLEFRVQGVMPPVEKLFAELGMKAVLERMVATLLPLPKGMRLLTDAAPDPRTRALRVLRAHERLAGLSEQNAREFDPLIEQLRQEIESASNRSPR